MFKYGLITNEELDLIKSRIEYVHQTGLFFWKPDAHKGRNVFLNGMLIQGYDYRGYARVHIKNKVYLLHRLAYFFIYGLSDQLKDIDHIDGNPGNNKINNLRLSTRAQNIQNKKISKNNTTGVKGISFHKKERKYYATINGTVIVDGKKKKKNLYCKAFRCLSQAIKELKAKREELHGEFANHG